MRTTLDIDKDVLAAAEALAAARRVSTGKIISELARRSLEPEEPAVSQRNGVPVLGPTAEAPLVTSETVEQLLDKDA